MAENEYTIPAKVQQAIKDAGYTIDSSMTSRILDWWTWYTAENTWYDGFEHVDEHAVHRHRMSLHPARRVCREWVSVMLDDEGTRVTAADEGSDAVLQAWLGSTRFLMTAQRCVERAFALGTGALALWFEVRDEGTIVRARRFDARMVVPLSWDDEGVSECAFCTQSTLHGRKVDVLQMHVLDASTGTYHVRTRMFGEGGEVTDDGTIADFDTGSRLPTFAVMRPNIDNVYADMSAFGQSVFADAIDTVKTVDECFDSFSRELKDTKIKTFMSDELFDVDPATGDALPMDSDASVIRKVMGRDVSSMIQTFAPDIRIDPITRALDMALSQLGDQTGFGPQYFRYDVHGGVKTATEVSSDNSAFARNIVKHENLLRPALEQLLACVLDCLRVHDGAPVTEGCTVSVDFDDAIIQDTDAERTMALAEMASMPDVPQLKADYLVRFKGYAPDEAARLVQPASEGADEGF